MKATSWRSSALLLLALTGCRQLLDIEEGSVVKDAPTDVVPVDVADDAPPCADTDADGVCNAVDTWPCGPEPGDLPATVTYEEVMGNEHLTIVLTNPTLDNARKLVVAPETNVRLRADWSIIDCLCSGCIDQIEVGFVPQGRAGCIYSANPQLDGNCLVPTTGMANQLVKAPSTPGAYTLRFRVGQNFACGTDTAWWLNIEPPASTSAVHLCVSP